MTHHPGRKRREKKSLSFSAIIPPALYGGSLEHHPVMNACKHCISCWVVRVSISLLIMWGALLHMAVPALAATHLMTSHVLGSLIVL